MKELTVLIAFLTCFITSYSQSESTEVSRLKLKKGFYFYFKEIRNDTPQFIDSFTVGERTSDNIFFFGGSRYTFDLMSKTNHEYNKIKEEIIGVSDGENFYISDIYTVGGIHGMSQCILSGPYLIALAKTDLSYFTLGGAIPSSLKSGSCYLINLKDGSSHSLTNRLLEKTLEKYPTIKNEYLNKDNLMEYAIEILEKINQTEK